MHARWAMLASVGALVPEILDIFGAFHFVEPIWWRVGYSKLKVSMYNLGDHSLYVCRVLLTDLVYDIIHKYIELLVISISQGLIVSL